MRLFSEKAEHITKPQGSAYINVQIMVGGTTKTVYADVCVDTGADMTLCTDTYLIKTFGQSIIRYIKPMEAPPKLRSASGHRLKILGEINLVLNLNNFVLNLWVIVQENKVNVFLLGSDSFYNKLIFDRGHFLRFADEEYEPVPIFYKLENVTAKAVEQFNIAPKSSALIKVKVTDNTQFIGKDIILSPINKIDKIVDINQLELSNIHSALIDSPVRDTISIIDSDGNARIMVENLSEDILTIMSGTEVADINLLSETSELNDSDRCIFYIDQESDQGIQSKRDELPWLKTSLDKNFRDKIPSNVKLRWENVSESIMNVNYVHDKTERKELLDGTGSGFPTPPAPESLHPDQPSVNDVDPDAWLKSIEHSHLTDEEWEKLKLILIKYSDAFSKSKTEIGCCKYFKVDLPLKPGTGYLYNKPRPLPHKHKEIAAQTISDLLEQGIIRPSRSPHATNIVVVKKKTMNGVVSYRVCCDLRQVNENSVPNRFPNYQMEDAMAKIQGSALRTACDFKNAFHQIMLTEESIPVTAFYFNNVLFEYVRVPFGHVCAMNAFCCLMALLCEKYEPSSYYADDLMITTKVDLTKTKDQIFDLHLKHISGMLERIIDAGLKLVAHKCQWCYDANKPMEWLGFTLESNLLKPQESKVKSIKEYPVPQSSKQAISFVSLASFYRRFIKSFAKIARPIYEVANQEPFIWTKEANAAFVQLKEAMCSDIVLRMPRQGEPFHMYSDASWGALGVVLCQVDPKDGQQHPCAYGSRKFNDTELKLSTPCKELLAIVYGLNLWSFYICGNPVHVYSDCRAWTFLKMQSGISGKISRLALLISEYDISISFVQGIKNKAADGLSRAFDDGTHSFDDQSTARHPALEKLEAPALPEGQVMKLNDYLDQCENYVSEHWPRILKEYEATVANAAKADVLKNNSIKVDADDANVKAGTLGRVNNVLMDELTTENSFIEKYIFESSLLHVDRVENERLKYKGSKVTDIFQFNDDLTDTEYDSDVSNESLQSTKTVFDEPKTTDSSFRPIQFNIRFVTINDSSFSLEAFREAQNDDEFCSSKMEKVTRKEKSVLEQGYFFKRKILMRKRHTKDGQEYDVICVPQKLIKPLLESTHRYLQCGHHGSQKYLLDMSRKYYWPTMKTDIDAFHKQCIPCQYNDKYPVKFPSGYVIKPLYPMHIVHCDLVVGLPKALDGSYCILLLYDGFSRFTYGIPLGSEKADYIVKKLMSHFVAAFGLPWALHSDNGKNIDGNLVRHLALLLGVVKTSTPPHTPNANPCETMCGAISMLLRKALNTSDQRYWSLYLPFLLNALNSTTHTATGYTPNSLFFGKFRERPLVPLVPFDAESANVNQYYQKMRRFQELSFQIARMRNEKRIQARKEVNDATARKPKYEEGGYVLIKNNNPALGPGNMKLRAKYVGPFRILKVYPSSLIVIPWTENEKLESYYRNPDIFRLMNRGDIRPFHTRMVSYKHCKPYYGVKQHEEIVDPLMLNKFLDMLDVNCNDEIVSVLDSNDSSMGSNDSNSLDSSQGPPPAPPMAPPGPAMDPPDDDDPDLPDLMDQIDNDPDWPGDNPDDQNDQGQDDHPDLPSLPSSTPTHSSSTRSEQVFQDIGDLWKEPDPNQPIDDLLVNVDLPPEDQQLLRDHYNQQLDDADSISSKAKSYKLRIGELEQIIRSSDKAVRQRAEDELANVLDKLKLEQMKAKVGDDETEFLTASSHSSDGASVTHRDDKSIIDIEDLADFNPSVVREAQRDITPETNKTPSMEWDNMGLEDDYFAPDDRRGADVKIHTRGYTVSIRPAGSNRAPVTSTPRLPTTRGQDRVRDWLSDVSPIREAQEPPREQEPTPAPRVTRAGRQVKPAVRFDPHQEELRQKELRDLAKALNETKQKRAETKKGTVLPPQSKVPQRDPHVDPRPGPSGTQSKRDTASKKTSK